MLVFNAEEHRYTLDGEELPSVTEICRFLQVDIAANAKPWLRDQAADLGSRVHTWCMVHDYGDLDLGDVEQDALPYVEAYIGFCRDYKPQWELIEHPMGNVELGFAGTLDRFGVIDGRPALLDIKTTSKLHKEALSAQLMGYSLLLGKEGLLPEICYGLRLDKHGCYDLVEIAPDYDAWIACKYLHEKLQRKRRKK